MSSRRRILSCRFGLIAVIIGVVLTAPCVQAQQSTNGLPQSTARRIIATDSTISKSRSSRVQRGPRRQGSSTESRILLKSRGGRGQRIPEPNESKEIRILQKSKKSKSGSSGQVQQEASLQSGTTELRMLFKSMSGTLQGNAKTDYASAIQAHLEESINKRTDIQVTNVAVTVNILSQRVVSGTRDRRSLQSSLSQLELISGITVQYRSEGNQAYDPAVWVVEAFDTTAEIKSFLLRLQKTNTAFDMVKSVTLTQNDDSVIGSLEQADTTNTGHSDNSATVGIIMGALCGSAITAALGFLYLNSRRSQDVDGNKPSSASSTGDETDATPRLETEIEVERQDDISTLGDTFWGSTPGGMTVYAKEYLLGQALNDSQVQTSSVDPDESGGKASTYMVGNRPTDDASSMQQCADSKAGTDEEILFEVHVPPGKLGMVIDTPNGGAPAVHAVKPESVMVNKVQVSDRLVSVDGLDVTRMTAVEASQLISIKSRQPRVLLFSRTVVNSNNVSTGSVRLDGSIV